MYYVYILQGKNTGKLYTGFTHNLRQRLQQHFRREGYTTKRMGKLELIYYEAFKAEADARRREKYLKTSKGKRMLKLALRNTLAPSSSGQDTGFSAQ